MSTLHSYFELIKLIKCRNEYQQDILDTEQQQQQQQYCFIHILFYIMSSLRELRLATFIPDLLKTCSQNLLEYSMNSYGTCPVHVNKMVALEVMSLTSLLR